MKTPNKDLIKSARESLSGKWKDVITTFGIYLLISLAISMIPKAGGLLSLIITGPFILGIIIYSLALSRGQNYHTEQIFSGFNRFIVSLKANILITLFTFLWTLLLVVPGIIASISYSMTFFILADDPSMGAMEAIEKSKKMMYGNKWKYFTLNLRFMGWAILCLFTFGIGFLWLTPYMQVAACKFYDDIKDNKQA